MRKLFVFLMTLQWLSVLGQTGQVTNLLPKILPGSPEAAGIAKFGNYSVSMFTGLPEITIPLYEIKVGDLSVPISISYHASGNKVNDNGSWVGLGWSLNSGGIISRKVMGLADDLSGNYLSGNTVKLSSEIDRFTTDGIYYLSQTSRGNYDTEPDIFSYSISGKSGKFFFNQRDSLQPVFIPYAPIKLKRNSSSSFPLIFALTDEHGVIHKFEDAEYTDNGGGLQTGGISSWMLTKLIAPNQQDSIMFTYTQRYGQVGFDYNDKVVVSDQASGSSSSGGPTSDGGSFGVFVDERKPNEILFPLGKVTFEASSSDREDGYAGQKALNKIKIFSKDIVSGAYSLRKSIVFYHSYFLRSADSAVRSLRLDSLGVSDTNEVIVEKFNFTYNSQLLPAKTSKARDYWGYYNGKNNDLLVPRQSISYQTTALSTPTTITIGSSVTDGREPDSAYMQAGILTSIRFPTGGRTEFRYETNRYSDDGITTKLAGGLRIRSIASYDGLTNKAFSKTYTYGINESGYGRKNFILNNYFFQVQQYTRTLGSSSACSCPSSEVGRVRVRSFVSNPSIELEPYDGSPVAYQTVTEYIGDSAQSFGKVIYEFTDQADGLNTAMTANKSIITSYHANRGQLSRKRIYRRNAVGSFTILSSTSNRYQAYPEQFFANVGFGCTKTLISNSSSGSDVLLGPENSADACSFNPPGCGANDTYSFQFANYSIRSSDNYLVETSDTTFDQLDTSRYVASGIKYGYANFAHQQVTEIRSTLSSGDSVLVIRKYPHEFSGSSVYDSLVSMNTIDKIVEETKFKNGVQTYLQKNNYKDWGNKNLLLDSTEIQNGGFPVETRAFVRSYSTNGKVISMKKAGDLLQSTIWSYLNSYPIANVVNADTGEIAYTSFEADGSGYWSGISQASIGMSSGTPTGKNYYNLSGNTLTRYGLSSAKTYIVSYWSSSGAPYSVSGTMMSTKTGTTVNGWTYVEQEVSGSNAISISGAGNIDELRLYPKGALMTTYTYAPLVGLTSKCDPSNRITYYEYDSMDRLSNVRDHQRNIIKAFEYKYRQQ